MLGSLFCAPKLALDIFAEIFPLMLQDYVYCRSTDIVFGELILVLSEICNDFQSRHEYRILFNTAPNFNHCLYVSYVYIIYRCSQHSPESGPKRFSKACFSSSSVLTITTNTILPLIQVNCKSRKPRSTWAATDLENRPSDSPAQSLPGPGLFDLATAQSLWRD